MGSCDLTPDSNEVIERATAIRHLLHKSPELSNEESETSRLIAETLASLKPTELIEGLGQNGVAAIFGAKDHGPTVLIRCELDALPIFEAEGNVPRSCIDGVAHLCGHDGHMAMVVGLAMLLGAEPILGGRVILLFQPAEENGQGALRVSQDERFQSLDFDFAFALHNLPGHPLGQIAVRSGTMNCGSQGLVIRLKGRPAHAAQPQTGISPAGALASLMQRVEQYGPGHDPHQPQTFATLVGVDVGSRSFGVAASQGEIRVTLRSGTKSSLLAMRSTLVELAERHAKEQGLLLETETIDPFEPTVNTNLAYVLVKKAAEGAGLQNDMPKMRESPEPAWIELEQPLTWSEDFGRIIDEHEGALIGIGAGLETAPLHDAAYQFPDRLLPMGIRFYRNLIGQCFEQRNNAQDYHQPNR